METIYLDHNSTTPVLPEVVDAMKPFFATSFGNAASVHRFGQQARRALEQARDTVRQCLHATAAEVIFTSGATEANNLALFGCIDHSPGPIAVSMIEHPSVQEPTAELVRRGYKLLEIPVTPAGVADVVDWQQLLARLDEPLQLAVLMLANNETGAIQPVEELAAIVRSHTPRCPFHCDAAQAAGKIPIDFHNLGASTLSLSGHKFNGPKGVGVLILRKGTRLRPLFYGGHQQGGKRPGTEPVHLAVGLAKALEIACREMESRLAQVRQLRCRLLDQLKRLASPVFVNGPEEGGLPHTLNVSFPGCRAEVLLIRLDLSGVACSAGSACSSGSLLPSPVLKAMKVPEDRLNSAIRLSLSHLNTVEEIDEAAKRIAAAVSHLRKA